MSKLGIGLVGIFLFFSSFSLGNNLRTGEKLAAALDNEETVFAVTGDDVAPPCSWNVSVPERVMAENKSQAVVVEVSNSVDVACESIVSLRAPGFDVSPAKDEQKITLKSGGKGSLSWILIPRKTGTFEIAISDIVKTRIYGITVKNVFGLTTTQAKSFSIVGSLFGPMFTVPWWVEKMWFRRKRKQEQQKDENVKG